MNARIAIKASIITLLSIAVIFVPCLFFGFEWLLWFGYILFATGILGFLFVVIYDTIELKESSRDKQ